MTTDPPAASTGRLPYALQKLLWLLRKDPALAARYRDDPGAVAAELDLPADQRAALLANDIAALYELGANPYVLYFGALESGMPRDDYYRRLRAGTEGG